MFIAVFMYPGAMALMLIPPARQFVAHALGKLGYASLRRRVGRNRKPAEKGEHGRHVDDLSVRLVLF